MGGVYPPHVETAPLETALRLVVPGGHIACFGGFKGRMEIDMSPLIEKQPTIYGSNGYAPSELVEAMDVMVSGRVDRATLISWRGPRLHAGMDHAFHADEGVHRRTHHVI
ncbi:MAG: hypothetical protein RIS94_2008 [Pseudomonadota bacterium]|jgi:threonine dehydrogenase-like Zn-dependent dehydrogenase